MKGIINSSVPGDVNVVIADGMFIIQTPVKDKTPTFAAFARSVLLKVLKLAKHRVDLCFHVYESPSIKDIKHESRRDENTEKHFTFGPRQRTPSDFNLLLKHILLMSVASFFCIKTRKILSMVPYWAKRYFIAL